MADRWNLLNLMKKYGSGAYRDFEGMTDGDGVLARCKSLDGKTYWWDVFCDVEDPEELHMAVRDIGLNLCYEMADSSSIDDLTPERVESIFYAVHEMLTCVAWTKSGLPDAKELPKDEVALEPRHLEALRLIGVYTEGRFNLDLLVGPAKRRVRKHIMEVLLGRKRQPNEIGINALVEKVYQTYAIPGDCNAARSHNFIALAKSRLPNG